jgi:hypothetical protein
MNARQVMNKAPNWVIWICGTIIALALIASVTVLTAAGASSDDLIRLIQTIFNFGGIILGGGAWITSAAAAKSASNLEDRAQVIKLSPEEKGPTDGIG